MLLSKTAQIHGGNQTKSVYCIPKTGQGRSGGFSSSLTKDVVMAFRTTAKLFSFSKEVPNGWIIVRNSTTKLGLFLDFIRASLLGATDLFITYHDKYCSLKTKKDSNSRLLLTGKRWVVRYTIYPFFTTAPLSVYFKTTSMNFSRMYSDDCKASI